MSHHFKAGILSYVLAIGLLVSVGLSMMILYIYYTQLEYKGYQQKIRLVENLETARMITLADVEHFEYEIPYLMDLYGEGRDSLRINKMEWGFIDVFSVWAWTPTHRDSMVYATAQKPGEKSQSCIFLVDEGRPLAVAGETKLIGNGYVPVSGIQSAYVGRIGYRNEELIYGEELKSDKELPETTIEEKFERVNQMQGNWIDHTGDTISNSYFNDLLMLSGSNLEIFGVYDGKVLIKASGAVVFDSLARTSGVIVYAPEIEFKSGFEGSGQFLATDTIILNKEVKLEYPSLLAVYNEKKPATIQTRGKAEIEGWVLMEGGKDNFRDRVIYFEDGTIFKGLVYCNGMFEPYADIIGHVTTKKFLVNAPSAVYENYLFNTTIDYTKLDTAFLTLNQWFYSNQARILQNLR